MQVEAWEDPETGVRFYITHFDRAFTTGVTVLPPHTELSAHTRRDATENLVQIGGRSLVKLLDAKGVVLKEYILSIGDSLIIAEGGLHIHANPYDEPSLTVFKAVGDTVDAVESLRQNFLSVVKSK